MTRRTPLLACLGLWSMLLCGSAVGADEDTAREIESLRLEIAKFERRLLPPVLLDRASIDAVFGNDTREYTATRGPPEQVTCYRLRAGATLNVRYVDGYAAGVHLHCAGDVNGLRAGTPPPRLLADLKRRHESCRALLEAYRDQLPPDGLTLPDRVCRALLAYLDDHPVTRLSERIIVHLPEDRDAELLPRIIRFSAEDQEGSISRRIRALAQRRPALVGQLVAALGDSAVPEARKETITDVLLIVSGYGGRALDSPWFWRVWHRQRKAPEEDVKRERATWWHEWWTRHRDGTRLDWLMEPLAIEKHRSDACVALGHLDDPKAIPVLSRLLDDGARDVRLYAANGLLRRKYEGRRYASVNYSDLVRDEDAVMAEAREWAHSRDRQADGAAKPPAPADTDSAPR